MHHIYFVRQIKAWWIHLRIHLEVKRYDLPRKVRWSYTLTEIVTD